MRHRDAERLGTLAAKPRLSEASTEGIVVATIADSVEREFLTVAGGERLPCVTVEDIASREVVELDTYLANNHAVAVATLQLQLACLVFLDLIDDIHRTVLGIGTRFGDKGLLLEVTECHQLATAADDGIATEEVAGLGVELAVDNLVVGDGVTLDDDVADASLLALDDTDFDIDRVVHHSHLDRSGGEEEVAVVHVHGSDVGTARVVGEVSLEGSLVVWVALLDT